MERKVILVTGGSGLVGKGIQTALSTDKREEEEWIFLSSKDADLLSKEETIAVFEKYKPTHVIHLAAFLGGISAHLSNQLDFFRKNMQINDNVLEVSHETDVKKVVSALTNCIFPAKTTYPVDETMLHNGPPHPAFISYGYAKRMTDVLNKAYNQKYGRMFTSVVPCSTFGPHDYFDLQGRVIPGLIRKAYEAKKNGTVFEIWGTGAARRQFIYNLDMAKLFIWAVREYEDVEPIIFTPDVVDELSIKEIAMMILDAFDFKGEVKYLTDKPDGELKRTASNAKLRKYLPEFKFTPIRQAINETVEWYVENYETARK